LAAGRSAADECAVCYEQLTGSAAVTVLSCGHIFHRYADVKCAAAADEYHVAVALAGQPVTQLLATTESKLNGSYFREGRTCYWHPSNTSNILQHGSFLLSSMVTESSSTFPPQHLFTPPSDQTALGPGRVKERASIFLSIVTYELIQGTAFPSPDREVGAAKCPGGGGLVSLPVTSFSSNAINIVFSTCKI
jgi:hypothetical protein